MSEKIGESDKLPLATLGDWCDATSCHGIYDLYHSKNWFERTVWFILIVACFGISSWQIIGLIEAYTTAPYYSSRIFLKDQGFAEFPNITLCSFNRARKDKVEAMGIPSEILSGMFGSQPYLYDLPSSTMPDHINNRSTVYDTHKLHWESYYINSSISEEDKDPKSVIQRVGFDCPDLALICSWGFNPFNCCDGAREVINQYGKCWSLQVPGDRMVNGVPIQSYAGSFNGLRITMTINKEKQYREAPTMIYNNYLDEGLLILPTFDPYAPLASDPLALSPGNHYYISLKNQVTYHKRPKFKVWQQECVENGKLTINRGNFSPYNCLLDCLQQLVKKFCNCVYIAETIKEEKTCNVTSWHECVLPTLEGQQAFVETCKSGCLEPCQEHYKPQTSVTFAKYPSDIYVDAISDFLASDGHEIPPEGLLVANLYYADVSITVMEKDEKLALFTLIGNVGGQLGLFLGVSVLTVFQFFYYTMKGFLRLHRLPTPDWKRKMEFAMHPGIDPAKQRQLTLPPYPEQADLYNLHRKISSYAAPPHEFSP